LDGPFCILGSLQNIFSLAEQDCARSSESDSPLVTQEKLGTDFLLQVRNGFADGRLSDVEAPRSFVVVQVSSNRGKIAKMSKLHN
jgi:hypothetical protein